MRNGTCLPAIAGFLALLTGGIPALAQQAETEPPPTEEPPGFWQRDTLTGDWGGLRTTLQQQGIALSGTYTGEVFANVQGGIKRGATYDGLFQPQLDIDLDKLLGWHGASFRVSMI